MNFPRLATTKSGSFYICNNCLRRNPFLSHSSKAVEKHNTSSPPYRRNFTTARDSVFPPPRGFAQLSSRRLLSLRGPDTTKFLQGLVTANVLPPSTQNYPSGGFYTAFLNGQGRLVNDVFLYPSGEEGGWFIEVDAKEAEKLFKHIKRYKLRAKFDLKLIEEGEMAVWNLWDKEGSGRSGEGEGWTQHHLPSSSPPPQTDGKKQEIALSDRRAPGMGKRILLPGGEKPEADVEESTEEAYTIRRYLKGVPEGQDELFREASLPQESNVDFMGGIDYRKGCYVGQELTIRTYHTGVVRKRVLPVLLYGAEEAEPTRLEYKAGNIQEDISAESVPTETNFGRTGKKGRSAGKWLKGIGNVGLGLCRLELMTDVVVQPGGMVGYKHGDEFKLDWEVEIADGEKQSKSVKAKAFVPSWHLRTGRGGLDKV